MCIVVYLSTDHELVESDDAFLKVERIATDHDDLPTPPLRFKQVYYVGSHLGCGCGFLFYDASLEELTLTPELVEFALDSLEPDERKQSEKSNQELFELINICLSKSDEAELWVTWSGGGSLRPQIDVQLDISNIDPQRFFLTEGHRYHLLKT